MTPLNAAVSAPPDQAPGDQVYVARQPIYDRKLNLFAYEVLFRDSTRRSQVQCGDRATSEVVVNTLMDIGLERIVGSHIAFINFTEGFLTGELPLPPMNDKVVLEVLENVEPEPELIDGLARLAAEGYRIALDDFEYADKYVPLLQLAHIVKLDVLAMDSDTLRETVSILRAYPLKLLAEKVETHDKLRECQALGFDYFQGYVFSKPDLISGKRPSGNRLTVLQLLNTLQNPRVEISELEATIARDASLALRLLSYINSAYFGLRANVTSIRRALTLVGRRGIRQWASLVLMTNLADGKPAELMVTGMVRAKMCERLGEVYGAIPADMFFTTGLFSILDALLDQPLREILDGIAIDPEAADALLERGGIMGETLGNVIDFERGEIEGWCPQLLERCQLAYIDALKWSREASELTGT
jgi:EAL and modified HD-GYP domain-containing signal transduction protein